MIKKIKDVIQFYHKELNLEKFEKKDIKINSIGNGENHLIYLAQIKNKKFIFRISFRPELESKLKKEFKILKKIPKQIGPEPLIFDNSKKLIPNAFMIQTFVSGKTIKNWTDELLVNHAKLLTKLHSKKSNKKTKSPYDFFIKRISFTKNNQPEVIKNDELIEKISIKLKTIFLKNKNIFDKKKNSVLIHGDLHNNNILVKNKQIKYVDWEEAQFGDNALDVATIIWFTDLELKKYKIYLNTYLKNLKDVNLEKRMILWLLYKDFSLLLHKKWQSLNPKTRAIKANENFTQTIRNINKRIEKRIRYFYNM